jgi:hypothetical protein
MNKKENKLESEYRLCEYGTMKTKALFHFFHMEGDELCAVLEVIETGEVHSIMVNPAQIRFLDTKKYNKKN